ncbi:MAG: hypothetical protein B6U88_01510 [Candidatus Aenigmarchaeota archaeon ex4484_56]|nr:MAG: hypothetical protein B6U88_01510 [Candidatus Aenigmarchaeota archaeon ex4484_56]
MIIGVSGKIGAGKTTLVRYLSNKGFNILGFSSLLREELKKSGMKETRENYIKLGNNLRKKYGDGYLAEKLAEKIKEGNYVLDGVRSEGEANILKKKLGKKFILIFIDADRNLRYNRIKQRQRDIDLKMDFDRIEKEDSDIGLNKCKELADIIIENNQTIKEFYKKIDEILES